MEQEYFKTVSENEGCGYIVDITSVLIYTALLNRRIRSIRKKHKP